MNTGAGRDDLLTCLVVHFPDCIGEGASSINNALCPDGELLGFFAVSFLHFVFYPGATEFAFSIFDKTGDFKMVDYCSAI